MAMLRSHKQFLLTAGLALIGIPAFTLTARAALQNSPKAVLDEAWQIINQDYVDPTFNQVNWQQARQTLLSQSYSSRAAAYAALREQLQQLNDPYTRFMSPEEFEAFNQETSGELVGVGLQLMANPQIQALTVVKPLENSPALRAGIQANDKILQINGTTTAGMTVEDAAQRIRGEAGTQITLTLQREEQTPFNQTLTREQIQVPVVDSALRLEEQHRVGYIRLDEFNAHAAEEMQKAIANLKQQQVDEFVLDLRNNPGGRLDQGIAIARMWINDGDIVRTVERHGKANQVRANHTALTNLPLAVLVNGNSASASEIVTGALQDDHRATVVGTQTFGKALVQSVNSLADGSGLNVTIAHYFTPSGLDINHRGITPDEVVPLTDMQQQELMSHPDQLGTAQDPQYRQAIAALEVPLHTTRSR
ncbi:S41 family peptidase [Oculatella sp. LEGE 06141]|nr:S41 family peptidase [Oculatella sp. LEGE 06141]